MARCQPAALTKDRELLLLTHTRTHTHTKQLELQPHLRQTEENQICSHPPASTAMFSDDLKLRESSLCALTNLSCQQRPKHQTQGTPRKCIKSRAAGKLSRTQNFYLKINKCDFMSAAAAAPARSGSRPCYESIAPKGRGDGPRFIYDSQRENLLILAHLRSCKCFPKLCSVSSNKCLTMQRVNEENMDRKGRAEMIRGTCDREV